MEDNLTIHPLLLWATVTLIKQERQLRQNKLEKSIPSSTLFVTVCSAHHSGISQDWAVR